MLPIRAALPALVLVASVSSTRLATAESPHDRLVTATNLSTLPLSSLQPWHLKLEVTVFDEHGEDPSPGTIEVWHDGHAQRTVFTFGSSTRTLINNDTGFFAAHTGAQIPALADSVLAEVLHPGPYQDAVNNASPEESKQKFGKVELECVMLSQPIRHVGVIPFGLYPTYCFDHGSDSLRASFNAGSYTVLRNEISDFQGQDVAYSLVILKGHNTHVADAKIVTLETLKPSAGQFIPDESMKKAETITRVSGGLMAGHIVTKASPIYPASAVRSHIGGTVVLSAVIGRDGRIRFLRPESAPDADLALAAIDAVRQWTYQPFLLNGEPTEVDTTITVNFNLNR